MDGQSGWVDDEGRERGEGEGRGEEDLSHDMIQGRGRQDVIIT